MLKNNQSEDCPKMGRGIIAWKVPYWKQLEADVDCSLTHKWLTSVELKAETEGLAVVAQDQSLVTRSYQHRILNQDVNPMCRVYNHYEETIDHITSGCPKVAKSEYIVYIDTIKLPLTSTGKSAIYKEPKIKVADKW